MPYSQNPPDVVFPDTGEARQDAVAYSDPEIQVAFCDEYEPDDQIGRNAMRGQCLNRNPWGERKHSWCFACMAGYVSWDFDDDPYSDSLDAGRQFVSW